ncbi:MAG: hypothetical protein AAGC44_13395 [Planctomycetota bacterium]
MIESKRVGYPVMVLALLLAGLGCQPVTAHTAQPLEPDEQEVTVIIALSAVVPAGVVGHAGLAVGDAYYDFGPNRVDRGQRLQGFGSPAGPWWDDPEQMGDTDHTLAQVIDQLDEKVYPEGSLIAVAKVRVSPEEAEQIAAYWDALYRQMEAGQRVYHLLGEQCANVVVASMVCPPEQLEAGKAPPVPRRLWGMSPTRLYRWLHRQDRLTATGRSDRAVSITLYQQQGGSIQPFTPWLDWSRLGLTPPVRARLGIERLRNGLRRGIADRRIPGPAKHGRRA